jgi:hypothetical protein
MYGSLINVKIAADAAAAPSGWRCSSSQRLWEDPIIYIYNYNKTN